MLKRMVCLANSRKLNGRCIAGKVLEDGALSKWLRPISERLNHEVSEEERRYLDGRDPQILDIIDLPLLGPQPSDHQRENWLLDPKLHWEQRGRAKWTELDAFADDIDTLWSNELETQRGTNDLVPVDQLAGLSSSLAFVHVARVDLQVLVPGAAYGNSKRRVQARFDFREVEYGLWVTDPHIERRVLAEQDHDHTLGECYLTVSLAEPFRVHSSKLVAGIVERSVVDIDGQ